MRERHRNWVLSGLAVALAVGVVACASTDDELEPDEAVERVAHGLADGQPVVAWQALPASYQGDVTALVHEFAGKMDAELWNRTFAVLSKLTRLLKEKRDYILDHPMLAQQLKNRAEVEESWDAVVGLLDVVATSELSDLKKVETLDVEGFLAGTGARFMKQLGDASALAAESGYSEDVEEMRALGALEATVVASSGDEATVRIEQPGQDPQTERLVRVEGKWVPAALAEGWSAQIAEARESLAKLSSQELQQNKQTVLMQLGLVEGALDTLLAADTPEQFNAGVGAVMGMAMGAMMSNAATSGFGAPTGASGVGEPAIPPTPTITLNADTPGAEPEVMPAAEPASLEEETPIPVVGPASHGGSTRGREIPVSEADRHVGRVVRVVTEDGLDARAKLTGAEGEVLTFERSFTSGAMSFELRRGEIQALHVAH